MILFEGVHPLEGGALRLKFRRDRRSGMTRENPVAFYARYWGGTALKEAEARFHRVRGHHDLPFLVAALKAHEASLRVDTDQRVA